jgi:hypothetical protein
VEVLIVQTCFWESGGQRLPVLISHRTSGPGCDAVNVVLVTPCAVLHASFTISYRFVFIVVQEKYN